jgi:hypothetical protein
LLQGASLPSQAEVRRELEKLTRTDAKCAIIGAVADFFETPGGGFYARFEIFDSFSAIVWLITNGYCTGLSLTHVVPNASTGTILPYELTVCERPARPHCYIVAGSPDAMVLHAYKGGLQGGTIRDRSNTLSAPPHVPIMTDASQIPADMAVDEAAPEVGGDTPESKIEQALAAMKPADAQLFAGRFESMMEAVEKARKEAVSATEEKEKAIKERMESDLNTGLLKSYVENLKAGIGADMCKTFHLDNVMDKDLDTTNIHQFKHTMQRVVHAASHALMMNRANTLASPAQNKRKMETVPYADEAPQPVVVASAGAAAAAAAPADARELLRRAIADQWSVTA